MKRMLLFLVLFPVILLAQDPGIPNAYIMQKDSNYCRTIYGAASFKADSHYVWTAPRAVAGCTVTISYDTTAGTTVAYWAMNGDSTNAIPLRPGTGGNYGDARTFICYGLKWYSVKGTVPVTTDIR